MTNVKDGAKQPKKIKEQYIGPNKVLGITKTELKTPKGAEVIEVVYADNKADLKDLMTLKEFELLATEKPTDLTDLRKRKFDVVVPMILEILSEYNIKSMEVEPLVQNIIHSLGDHFDRAANYLWTKNDKLFIPGTNHMANRTLMDCHRVFEQIKEDNKSNEPETGTEK